MKFECELIGISNTNIKNCSTKLADLSFQDLNDSDYTFTISTIDENEAMKLEVGKKYTVEFTKDLNKKSKIEIPTMRIDSVIKDSDEAIEDRKLFRYSLSSENVKENFNYDYYSLSYANSTENEFKYGDLIKITII